LKGSAEELSFHTWQISVSPFYNMSHWHHNRDWYFY
jgi:hypothetical protein